MKNYHEKNSSRGTAIPSTPGGNWPSTTNNPSGDGRGNRPHK